MHAAAATVGGDCGIHCEGLSPRRVSACTFSLLLEWRLVGHCAALSSHARARRHAVQRHSCTAWQSLACSSTAVLLPFTCPAGTPRSSKMWWRMMCRWGGYASATCQRAVLAAATSSAARRWLQLLPAALACCCSTLAATGRCRSSTAWRCRWTRASPTQMAWSLTTCTWT